MSGTPWQFRQARDDKKGKRRYLAPAAVVQVVVVQAQDGGEVGHQRVRLPAAVLEPPPERAHGVTPKDRCQPTHERRLSAPGVGGHTDKDNLLSVVGVDGMRRRRAHKKRRRRKVDKIHVLD